jgi:hypothetical protein
MKGLFACGLALLALVAPSVAADTPDVAFLRALFATDTIDASLFDVAFVQRVPVADVQTLVDGYRQRLGALQTVERDPTGDQLRFANGSLRATVEIDDAGKVAGLRFHDEQSEVDRAAIVRVLSSDHADSTWFTQGFLDQISISQIDALSAQVRAAEGPFVRVESRAGVYYAVFANAENIVQIATSRSGKIAYLTLAPGTPKTPSP